MPVLVQGGDVPASNLGNQYIQGLDASRSLMDRADANDRANAQAQQQQTLFNILAPLKQAQTQADMVKATTSYDSALRTQDTRASAYNLYNQAGQDFDFLNQIPDAQARATASREWLSRYSQLANVSELKPEMDVKNHLATENILDSMKLNLLGTAEGRTFNQLISGMSPEDQDQARRVKVGIAAKPSSAAVQYKSVTGPDGVVRMVAFDPRAVGAQVMGSGETYGSGVPTIGGPATMATPGLPPQAAAPSQQAPIGSDDDTIPAASAPTPAAPENLLAGISPAAKKAQEVGAEADAKYQATLRQELPVRQVAMQRAEVSTQRLSDDLDGVISQASTASVGPGGVLLAHFPGTTAKDLQSNLDSIKSNLFAQAIGDLKAASGNGSTGLGRITNVELENLQSQLGSLSTSQSPTQFVQNLKKVKQRIQENFGFARMGFEAQFKTPYQSAAPSAPASSSWDASKEQRFQDLLAKRQKDDEEE